MEWLKTLISNNPDVSFARASGAAVLFLMLTATAWSVWHLHQAIPDLPVNWLTLILALYGVSKVGDVLAGLKSGKKGGDE